MSGFCGECKALEPKETKQTKFKEPHICLFLQSQVFHYGEHPHIVRHTECPKSRLAALERENDRLVEAVKQDATSGLLTDEAHHKQWYLERILRSLGINLLELRDELRPEYDWEDGIAP